MSDASPSRDLMLEGSMFEGARCQSVESARVPGWYLRLAYASTLSPWHLGTLAPWHPGTLAPWHLVLRPSMLESVPREDADTRRGGGRRGGDRYCGVCQGTATGSANRIGRLPVSRDGNLRGARAPARHARLPAPQSPAFLGPGAGSRPIGEGRVQSAPPARRPAIPPRPLGRRLPSRVHLRDRHRSILAHCQQRSIAARESCRG